MRRHAAKAAIVAASLMGMLSQDALADRVVLKNGQAFDVQIVSEDPNAVTVRRLDGTTLRVPRNMIASVEKSAPGLIELSKAADAARRADFKTAREMMAQAQKLGAPADRLAQVAGEIANAEREREAQIHAPALKRAADQINSSKFTEAVDTLQQVIALVSQDSAVRRDARQLLINAYLGQARQFRDVVDDDNAIRALTAALEIDPNRADAYLELGELYAKNSRTHALAIENYRKGLQFGGQLMNPASKARVHFTLGELLRDSRFPAGAFEEYMDAFRLQTRVDPRIEDRIHEMAMATITGMKPDAVDAKLDVIERALAVKEHANLLERRAQYLGEKGQFDEAAEVYRRLLVLNPKARMANYSLAQIALRRGELFEARTYLETELANHPDNYDALCQYADLALQRDDYDTAESYFKRANEADRTKRRAGIGLARVMRLQKKLEEASTMIDQLLQADPSDLEANLEKGLIFRAQEEYEQAGEFFSNVLGFVEKSPERNKPEMKRLWADALLARGEVRLLTTGPATANNDFSAALGVIPNYPAAFYNIGLAYKSKFSLSKAQSDLGEAEKNLLKAIELNPKSPQYALALGILYHQSMAQVQEDPTLKKDYLTKAIQFYRSYITLGGADAAAVQQWIKECGGT